MTAFYDATQVMTDNFVVFRFLAINCTINTRHFDGGWNQIKTVPCVTPYLNYQIGNRTQWVKISFAALMESPYVPRTK